MIFLVNDANILIDLLKIELLQLFFRMEFDFQVTDLAFAEIEEENSAELTVFLENNLLTKRYFEFAELLLIQEIRNQHAALSVPDCSCLFLADKLGATLLTGDALLRRIAQQHGIPVHGMLWILDTMIAKQMITKAEAYDKLLKLMAVNPRLPQVECQKRVRSWKPR